MLLFSLFLPDIMYLRSYLALSEDADAGIQALGERM